jgi:nucleoredoxin
MDHLLGDTFQKGSDDTIELEDVLGCKDFVAIYFGAHWCPPCRGFTHVLKEVYERINEDDKRLEIIFCSYDGNEAAFDRNYLEMPWLALSYSDTRNKLYKQQFGVTGIPTLVVLNKSGEVVTYDGRSDVQSMREDCIEEWKKI